MGFRRWLARMFVGVQYVLLSGLYVLSLIWPREETLWVFGAKGGDTFVDNTKYLYLYTVEEREHIRAVWLSRNMNVIEELQSHGCEAYHADSLYGKFLNLRAGSVFVSHGTRDVNMWCSGGGTVIGLWHGVMLKQIKWDFARTAEHPLSRLIERGKYTLFKNFDWIAVTSEAMIAPFSSGRRMDPSRVIATGYPRNDLLDGGFPEQGYQTEGDIYETAKKLHKESSVLLYAPTYHEETNQQIRDHLDLAELDSHLADLDAHLIIKLHPREQLGTDLGEFSRLSSMSSALDVYPLLPYTDVLITDYSSLYFDYLLLDRPVLFYPFDQEQYRSARGFHLDYEAVTPGPIATDFDGLLTNITTVLEADTFADERRAVRDEFLQQPTESRCKTICDLFDPATTVGSHCTIEES